MTLVYDDGQARLFHGDCRDVLASLPAASVHCCVTSPPYFGLRAYSGVEPAVWGGEPGCGHIWSDEVVIEKRDTLNVGFNERWGNAPGQRKQEQSRVQKISQGSNCQRCTAWRGHLGMEPTADALCWTRGEPPCPSCFVCHLRTVFAGVWRVLRDDGTLWLNLGPSYNGSGGAGGDYAKGGIRDGQPKYPGRHEARFKPKDLMMIPEMVAMALQADGWILRSHIVWAKKSCMPESCTDRPTSAWESIFLLAKSPVYFYDAEAVRQPHADPNVVNGVYQGKGGVKRPEWIPNPKDGLARSPVGMKNREYNPAGANLRNVWRVSDDDPGSDFWLLGPSPNTAAHFATFVSEVPRRAIAAGTSEHGVCSACGAPWVRVVEREAIAAERNGVDRKLARGIGREGGGIDRTLPPRTAPATIYAGWQPSCSHAAPVVPATVLDCFIGSGTTCLAAKRLGRRSVGVDASAEYLEIAKGRISQLALMPMEVGA